MESLSKPGCRIRNQKDPYQFQCVFSNDPEDRRDFSVYFKDFDGRQDLMVRCAFNEKYECKVIRGGLSVTEDYITVSETFSEQNGSFVCRNGGPPLEQFPCFYSGTSIKSEMKYGTMENGSITFPKPDDSGADDNNNEVIIGASLGVVIIILCLVIVFLLYKMRIRGKHPTRNKPKEEQKSSTTHKSFETIITPLVDTYQPLLWKDLTEKPIKESLEGDTTKTQCNQINEGFTNSFKIANECLPKNYKTAIKNLSSHLSSNQVEPNDWKSKETTIRRGPELSRYDVRKEMIRKILTEGTSEKTKTQHGQCVLDGITDRMSKRVQSF